MTTDEEFVKSLIAEEAKNCKDCEEARQSMLNKSNTVKSLQITVDDSLWESLKEKSDVRSQLLGKGIFAEVNAFVSRYPVLKESVARGVELKELSFDEGEVRQVHQVREWSGAPELLPRDVENFSIKMEKEKREVVKALKAFGETQDNQKAAVESIWEQMFGMRKGYPGYVTGILQGGLIPTGRLTRSAVERFDALQQGKGVLEKGFTLENTVQRKKVIEDLEEMEAEYYDEIWGLEDAMPKLVYLNQKCVPAQSIQSQGVVTREKGKKNEERVEDEEEFWEEVMSMIEDKWDRRRILAARVMNFQGRKQVPVVPSPPSGRNVKAIIAQGYVDVANEICSKIAKVANLQIRGQLNKPADDGHAESEYNALDKRNLNGVMRALEQEYKHAPVTMVFHSLREMYVERNEKSYTKCVKWMDNQVSLWAELDLFSYLVPDILFTMMEVHQMPKGAVRDRCYQAVLDRMRESPEDYHPEKLKGRRDIRVLPLRRVVMDVIKDSVTVNGETEDTSEPVKKAWKPAKFVPYQPVVQGSTQAMKTAVEGQVTVEDQQWVQLKGKNLSYTSTVSRCEKCSSDDETLHHKPRCFLYQCHRCQMWGHRIKNCQGEKK